MKLRNKKTGEVVLATNMAVGFAEDGTDRWYHSLAELNEEWEDYKEPNERWYINEENEPQRVGFGDPVEDIENLEELGLLFNTKEETEKTVEKLKALKRLKDNGFEFENWRTWESATGYSCFDRNVAHSYYAAFTFRNTDRLEKDEQVKSDLDLLFGGEK